MPRRTVLELAEYPFQFKGKSLRMNKAYSIQNYQSNTILTDDTFTYIDFFFSSHTKAMKYRDPALKARHGDASQYHYSFYWKQAMAFYNAAQTLPIESSPLASYYSMLNAVKALIAYREKYVDDFINDFSAHGLAEEKTMTGDSLEHIGVKRYDFGVFVHFGKMLEPDFATEWPKNTAWTLKKLLSNLAYLHRAFITTYTTPRRKIPEQFLPVAAGKAPVYRKANDGNLYLTVEVEKSHFSPSLVTIPSSALAAIAPEFVLEKNDGFILRSANGAKRNSDSISKELKELNTLLRKKFQYIKSERRLWYLRERIPASTNFINVSSMLIEMAAMHRFSEIVRYKPERLARLMSSNENWLIHEFLTLTLNQFIDEIAAEITGQDIMCTGVK